MLHAGRNPDGNVVETSETMITEKYFLQLAGLAITNNNLSIELVAT
jgi:hypothetical protein